MSRKHNPVVALVALILMILLVMAVCTGCDEAEAEETQTDPRFIFEQVENAGNDFAGTHIITDTETGVQYILVKYLNGTGLTKLEPAPAE